MSTIPEAAIEAAAKVSYEHSNSGADWARCHSDWRRAYLDVARVALEAAHPFLVREAWDEGFTAGAGEHMKQRHDPTHPITRTNPYPARGGVA